MWMGVRVCVCVCKTLSWHVRVRAGSYVDVPVCEAMSEPVGVRVCEALAWRLCARACGCACVCVCA